MMMLYQLRSAGVGFFPKCIPINISKLLPRFSPMKWFHFHNLISNNISHICLTSQFLNIQQLQFIEDMFQISSTALHVSKS